jgi:DNA-binding NarL/FixJ family response regulator
MANGQNIRGRVLSVGAIAELVSLRHAILEENGYDVFSTMEPREAATRIREGDCGVLLICYSVPKDWRQALVRDFREHCPDGKIVGITDRPVIRLPKDVDGLVYGIDGPEALMDAIRGKAA